MERTGGADLAFIRSRQSTFDNRAGSRSKLVRSATDVEKACLAQVQEQKMEEIRRNPFVVDWYSLDDTDNPRNVSPIVPLLPHAAHRFL